MAAMRGYMAERGLAEGMFRLAIEACPCGMLMVDDDGKIVMVNSDIEHQFGYRRKELIGQPVELLIPMRVRGKHLCYREDFITNPETRPMGIGREFFGRRKDGSEFPVEVGLNPIHTGEQVFLILAAVIDISERKRLERLKEDFVATVSHELRTPLTSIAGSLGLLAGQMTEAMPESQKKLVRIAHANSERLVRLINDILDMEKIESGRVAFEFSRINLRLAAEQAIEANRGFAEGFGVNVRLDDDASVDAEVNADPDRLAQLVTNLLSNAIKFSPRDAEVLVAVERAQIGNAFRVSVRDHGSGVPEGFKPHIFEKFAQAEGPESRKKGGTGLGLYIAQQIVERLSGQIGFEEALGGGTTFYVDLPAWEAPRNEQHPPSSAFPTEAPENISDAPPREGSIQSGAIIDTTAI
jgi:PAS domain S-box-containing protein